MKLNIDLNKALTLCRNARRMGKISGEVQSRLLRRLGYAPAVEHGNAIKTKLNTIDPQWASMMNLVHSINEEIAPILKQIHEVSDRLEDGICKPEKMEDKSVTMKITEKPALIGYEYTPAWFEEQSEKEHQETILANKAAKAAMSPEQVAQAKAERAARKAARQAVLA